MFLDHHHENEFYAFFEKCKKKFLTFNKKWCSEKYFYKSKFKVGKFRKIFRNFYFFSSNLWHTTSLKLSWNLWKIDIYENRNLSILWKISKFSVKIFFQISRNWKKFFHKKIFFFWKNFFKKLQFSKKRKLMIFEFFQKNRKFSSNLSNFIIFFEFLNLCMNVKKMTQNWQNLSPKTPQKPILSWF
jgi:hypothetical protein